MWHKAKACTVVAVGVGGVGLLAVVLWGPLPAAMSPSGVAGRTPPATPQRSLTGSETSAQPSPGRALPLPGIEAGELPLYGRADLAYWIDELLFGPGATSPPYVRLQGLVAAGATTRDVVAEAVLARLLADAETVAPRLRYSRDVCRVLRSHLLPSHGVRTAASTYMARKLDPDTHWAHQRVQADLAGWPGSVDAAELLQRFEGVPRTADEGASIFQQLLASGDREHTAIAVDLLLSWWERDKQKGRELLPVAVDAFLCFRGVADGLTELAGVAERLIEAGSELPHDVQLLASQIQRLLRTPYAVEPRWDPPAGDWRRDGLGWLARHGDLFGESPGAQYLTVTALLSAPQGDVVAMSCFANVFRTSGHPFSREMALLGLGTVTDLRTTLRMTGVVPSVGAPSDQEALRVRLGLAGAIRNALIFHPEDQDLGAELIAAGLRASRGDSAILKPMRQSYVALARDYQQLPAVREMLETLAAGADDQLAAVARRCLEEGSPK